MTTRRGILKSAAILGGGIALAREAQPQAAAPGPALPTVRMGKHEVTRLLVGANPLYGYSHTNRLLDAHMREWCTSDRVFEVLRQAELSGINTWQLHYSDQTLADLKRHHAAGGKLQALVLGMGKMMSDPAVINDVAKLGPIGIAHHGNMTDDRFRAGEMHKVHEFLRWVRDSGVMVGVSCHNPEVVDYIESKGWDVDYYMTCFYRVSRTKEEARKELGEAPLGEVFLEKDPERMCKAIRQTRKKCFGFKILAAGRLANSPQQVEDAFRYALDNIKPQDCIIVGMYPRYRDEVQENAGLVRRLCARTT